MVTVKNEVSFQCHVICSHSSQTNRYNDVPVPYVVVNFMHLKYHSFTLLVTFSCICILLSVSVWPRDRFSSLVSLMFSKHNHSKNTYIYTYIEGLSASHHHPLGFSNVIHSLLPPSTAYINGILGKPTSATGCPSLWVNKSHVHTQPSSLHSFCEWTVADSTGGGEQAMWKELEYRINRSFKHPK